MTSGDIVGVYQRPGTVRRLHLLFGVLCMHGLLFAVSEYYAPGSAKSGLRQLYETFAFFPLQLGSAIALLVAARRADLATGSQRALRCIAFGFAALVAGSVVSIISSLLGKPLPYTSWADLVYYQFYPGIVLGMIALPGTKRAGSRARLVLDTSIVVLAFGSLIVFAMVFGATSDTRFGRVLVLLDSVAQLVTLLFINRAVERADRTPSRGALYWLLGALAISAVGDLVFQLTYSTGYRGPNWSRAASIAANLAVIWSAIRFYTDPMPVARRDTTPGIPFSPLPIVAVTSVALMVIWLSHNGTARGLEPLILGILALNIVLVARDLVSARDAAQVIRVDANRHAQQRLNALVQHSTDAILLSDAAGRLLFASPPAGTLFGAHVDLLVGQSLTNWVLEEDRVPLAEFLERLRESPGSPLAHTWRLRRSDGSVRSVESVGLDLQSEPAVQGLVLNSRDVTARIALEDRLRHAQKLEVVGHLAGGVAHDFNNVLTAIVGGAELAQSSIPPESAAHYDLEQIRAAAARGAALTRRLLTFVRVQSVPSQNVNVADMLADIEPLLRRLCGDPICLTVDARDAKAVIRVDRDELEHILFNLVANARDAMPGGGLLSVVAKRVVVRMPMDDAVIPAGPGHFLSIAVRDEGTGMDAEARHRMFDPFFSSKTGGRGTGLGLIGVRPLIEAAAGGLIVESQEGEGTRVELLLPVIDMDVPARAAVEKPAPRVPLAARVLLIEDEIAVRDSLARLLAARGAIVHSVGSAAEARVVLADGARGFDCALCDVMMPGETGLELRHWIIAHHPELPVLMMSGHTGAQLDPLAQEQVEQVLIRKPFTGDELVERLRQVLTEAG